VRDGRWGSLEAEHDTYFQVLDSASHQGLRAMRGEPGDIFLDIKPKVIFLNTLLDKANELVLITKNKPSRRKK
jgi:hypothetical protein